MIQKLKAIAIAILSVAVCRTPGRGQTPLPSILAIDVENFVSYRDDVTDISKLATDPNITTTVIPKNFQWNLTISDIVAVNGEPAKGTWIQHGRAINLSPNPNPGQAIADMVRGAIGPQTLEILKSDGSPIGPIMVLGVGGQGSPPPRAPSAATQANNAIVGGAGAFLGARGSVSFQAFSVPHRQASMSEDPA